MVNTDAACAHDIQLYKQKMIYLDSLGGNIVHGDKKIIQNGRFLKGLAVRDENIIYGDNQHTVRGDRFSTFSEVVSVNTDTMVESSRVETTGVIQQIAIFDWLLLYRLD